MQKWTRVAAWWRTVGGGLAGGVKSVTGERQARRFAENRRKAEPDGSGIIICSLKYITCTIYFGLLRLCFHDSVESRWEGKRNDGGHRGWASKNLHTRGTRDETRETERTGIRECADFHCSTVLSFLFIRFTPYNTFTPLFRSHFLFPWSESVLSLPFSALPSSSRPSVEPPTPSVQACSSRPSIDS